MTDNQKNKFKTVLVGLDHTEMDRSLIQFAARLCKTVKVENLYFVHSVGARKFPDHIVQAYPDAFKDLDKALAADFKKIIEPEFEGLKNTQAKVEIVEGNPIESLLRFTKDHEVDLILMGRKQSLEGSGIVSSKLARKAPCSLLLVPERTTSKINHITVPLDFSSHSALALSYAREIADKTAAKISCLHLYAVPIGFYKTGKTHEEFAEIMERNAQNEFKQFSAKNGLAPDLQCGYALAKGAGNADLILEKSRGYKTDLLVIGSRGRTAPSAVLMGSLAEKLVYKTNDFPILIAKKKGENMGFLQALLRI